LALHTQYQKPRFFRGFSICALDGYDIEDKNEDEHSVAISMIDVAESGNPDELKGLIHDIVARLFDDAGVAYERISKRGEHYSIANEAYDEFDGLFDYPRDE
jgi:hypothetical protein